MKRVVLLSSGDSFVAVAAIEGRLYLAKYTEGVAPGSTSVRLELVIVVIIHGFGFGFVCVGINGSSSINQQRMLVKSVAEFPQ